MAYSVVARCTDGTLVLRPGSKEPAQKGTPIFAGTEKAGAVIETIGRVGSPLVVARMSRKFADEAEFQ
jgi:rRNA processing protein Gar1